MRSRFAALLALLLVCTLVRAASLVTSSSSSYASRTFLDIDGDQELNRGLPSYIFSNLGQYSPRYDVASEAASLSGLFAPPGCTVDSVSSLERHGARYFTDSALASAKSTLKKLQAALVSAPSGSNTSQELKFLPNATLLTGTNDLVPYGALQAWHSGRSTAQVYPQLSRFGSAKPFIRTSGDEDTLDDRVILTSRFWALGFSGAPFPSSTLSSSADVRAAPGLPRPDVIFSEKDGFNNTLDVSTCTADNDLPSSQGEKGAQARYGASTLVPRIGSRLTSVFKSSGVESINLTSTDILNIGTICSFETLSRITVTNGKAKLNAGGEGGISPWCSLLKKDEWPLIGYALDVGKFFGAGYGNPYSRAVGQGYLRELLARLTSVAPPLEPATSLNTTIDGDPSLFPLPSSRKGAPTIFFDGSHDNNIGPIVTALGLFSGPDLSTDAGAEEKPHEWVFSRIAPLQGKIVFEHLTCRRARSEKAYLRVRANGKRLEAKGAQWCPSTDERGEWGLCPIDAVKQHLSFTQSDDEWRKCYA